jgi:hypothetical protein
VLYLHRPPQTGPSILAPRIPASGRRTAESFWAYRSIYVDAADGRRDYVDCGLGRDSFTADSVDEVRNCEVPALAR